MDNLDLDFLFESHPDANLQLADPYLLSYYKDLQRRTIFITEEIGDNCYDLIKLILQWNYEDRGIEPQDRETIRIIIASMGGSLESAESLCNIIELSETPIWTMGIGCVATAASLIFLAGHKRFILQNGYFILHKGSVNKLSGSADEVRAFMRDYEKQLDLMRDYYVSHTKYTKEEIDSGISGDWYVRGDEILEKGIAHDRINDIGVFFS